MAVDKDMELARLQILLPNVLPAGTIFCKMVAAILSGRMVLI